MRAIKQYFPLENPLPKVQRVRTHVRRDGRVVKEFWRKPKFRKGTVIGYK